MNKKWIKFALLGVLLAVFIFSGIMALTTWNKYRVGQKKYSEAADKYTEVVPAEDKTEPGETTVPDDDEKEPSQVTPVDAESWAGYTARARISTIP